MPAANNAFASPTVLTGLSGSVGFDNTGATYESGEPANDLGADGAASVWFLWTLGSSADGNGWNVTIDTVGTSPSTADTTLEVFTGSTLAGLTLLGSSDDIDYPSNVQSELTLLAVPDGTVLRIRVDSWISYGSTGPTIAGVLAYSAAPVPPDAPTASGWTDITGSRGTRTMWAGDDIEIVGTGLDTVTGVTIGGVAQPFTITDSTHLTVTVTTAAVSGPVVVSNAGGSATAPNGGFSSALVYYPGPWTYSADLTATDTSNPSTQAAAYSSTAVAATQPDLAGAAFTGSGGFYGLVASGGDLSSDAVSWDLTGVVIVLDERSGTYTMPDYSPTAEVAADPDAVDYAIDSTDTPIPTSDITITFDVQTGGTNGKSTGEYNEDSNSRSLSEDLWQASMEYRRLPDSDWTFDGLLPKFTSGVWPSKTHAASLPLDFTRSALNPGAALTTSSAGSWTDNHAALVDGAAVGPQGPTGVSWADFGDARAWLVTLSPLVDASAISPPVIDPTPALRTGSIKQLLREADVRGTWTYRPRRYRLIYTSPPGTVVGTLRRRQQAAPVGSAPRRRQIAARAGSPRRGPGAAR
jgi:hypothetical protein